MKTFNLFIYLAKKSFFRAPYWERNLVVKILMGFLALYFLVAFLLIGITLFFILEEIVPDKQPMETLNQVLFYYFLLELFIRYFVQKLPVTQIQQFLTLPISKTKIVHWVMLRTGFSFFNVTPFIIFLPFTIVTSIQQGWKMELWAWWLSTLFLILSINYLVFLINKSTRYLFIALGVLLSVFVLDRWSGFSVPTYFGEGYQLLLTQPLLFLVPLFLFLAILRLTKKYLKEQLFLDQGLKKSSEKVIGSKLSFFDGMGIIGTFLKNDIRLIIRNIRARQVIMMGFFFLFYGLIFFTQEIYRDNHIMNIFAATIISGGFMITFGQYVPAWDSEYYSFLMGQNIPYKKYLESKWYLMVFVVLVSLILSTPYLYFGWDIYKIIIATAIFNMGLGSFITLFSGALNRAPLKLNVKAKAFENTQAFNITQFLFALPKMGLPILIFYVPFYFIDFDAGIYALGISGIIGLFLKTPMLNAVEKLYQKGKYKTIASFNKTI